MRRGAWLTAMLALLAGSGCGRVEETASQRGGDQATTQDGSGADAQGVVPSGGAPTKTTKTKGGGSNGGGGGDTTPNGGDVSKDNGDGTTPDGGGQGSDPAPGGSGGGTTVAAGPKYFDDVITPMLNQQCALCHADPRENPPVRGPLTIFSYKTMRTLLAGNSSTDNGLLRKVRNLTSHGGGDRCRDAGPTATPCKELIDWWRVEFGKDSGFDGGVAAISPLGGVSGFAVDTTDVTKTVSVRLYVDAPGGMSGGATPALTLMANVSGVDGGYQGDHALLGTLPAAVRDGKPHAAYLFVVSGDKEAAVGPATSFTAYAPRAAGQAYFTKTVAPLLQTKCSGCHVVGYDQQYASLIGPAPSAGGTAMDNQLIDKASGTDHPGGNICGSKTGSPCDTFQQWWTLEFGP